MKARKSCVLSFGFIPIAAVAVVGLLIASGVGTSLVLKKGLPGKINSTKEKILKVLPGKILVNKNLSYGTDKKQKLDLCLPKDLKEEAPGVILIHGGGGDKKSFLMMCKSLAKEGLVAATINFREEPPPSYPKILEDVSLALIWLKARDEVNPKKIGAVGGSLGGYIASLTGTSEFKDKVVCVENNFGPTDFTDPNLEKSQLRDTFVENFFGGVTYEENPDLYIRLSPITHVSKDDAKFFFTRSKNDKLVPRTQMTLMIDKLNSVGIEAEFYEYEGEGTGHANKLSLKSSALLFSKRVSFVKECLSK